MLPTCCQTWPDSSSLCLPYGWALDQPQRECHSDGTEQVRTVSSIKYIICCTRPYQMKACTYVSGIMVIMEISCIEYLGYFEMACVLGQVGCLSIAHSGYNFCTERRSCHVDSEKKMVFHLL